MTSLFSSASRQRRGFAIIMVLILLAVLMGGIAVLFGVLTSTGRTAGSMIDRRKSFYQCDGTARVITKIAQDFTLESDTPGATDGGTAEMQRYVCDKTGSTTSCTAPLLPNIVDTGYEIEHFELVPLAADMQPTVLQSGAFRNMQAQEMPILLQLKMQRTATGNRCEIEQEVSIGSIAMFQFFVFSEDAISWSPGQPSTVYGRIHANGDICLGADTGLHLQTVTSTEGIYSHGHGPQCGGVSKAENVWIWQGGANPYNDYPDTTGKAILDTTSDRQAQGASWQTYATARWNGQVQDVDHNVPELRLPIAAGIEVQPSKASDLTDYSNVDSARYLVDPLLTSDDNSERAVKLACKSDIRIINGAWYLASETRSVSDPCGGWPGTPIWSDHPGNFTPEVTHEPVEMAMLLSNPQQIGQAQIATNESWGSVPERYSYYRFNSGGNPQQMQAPHPAKPPVVSYGPMKMSGGRLVPAHWVLKDGGAEPVCQGVASLPDTGNAPFGKSHLDVWSDPPCGANAVADLQSLLDGARTGLVDPQIFEFHPLDGNDSSHARFLTINFDVDAFRQALADGTGNELGSYFPGTSGGSGRVFNGIVWIGNTWTGSLDGFGTASTFPGGTSIFPLQGTTANSETQPRAAPAATLTGGLLAALPYELCSQPEAPEIVGEDMTSATTPFKVPSCDDYNESMTRAIPFRIVNAQQIGSADPSDSDVLPDGLSIVSNSFGYVWGDVNTVYGGVAPTDAQWVPFMVAADHIRYLSNNWDDGNTAWGYENESDNNGDTDSDSDNDGERKRPATETTWNLCMIAGHTLTKGNEYSGGIENFPGFIEDWDGVNAIFNGSFVKGFSPVYLRFPQRGRKRVPNRPWSYDAHLNSLDNQPPGAPRYDIQAVRTWRR